MHFLDSYFRNHYSKSIYIPLLLYDDGGDEENMGKLVPAVLFAALLFFPAIASIANEDAIPGENATLEEILEFQKRHVTEEEWAEIEELLAENQRTGALPDLIITDFWKSGRRLYAWVHNGGDGYAHIFYVDFHIYKDGK